MRETYFTCDQTKLPVGEGNFLQNPTCLPTLGRSVRVNKFCDLTAYAHHLTKMNADT